jgi:hypothetical protein
VNRTNPVLRQALYDELITRLGEATPEKERKMQDQQVDQLRIKYGLWIILTGFLLVALITVASFLGVQVGSAGKERVEADRVQLEETVRLALSLLPPEVARQVHQEVKDRSTPEPQARS